MSEPTFTPLTVSHDSFFSLVWTDTSAYFLPEYNYRITINNLTSPSIPTINNAHNALTFNGVFSPSDETDYTVNVSGTNGTFIYNKTAQVLLNVNCFVKDTEILTKNEYIKIQDLNINDEVQTYKHGLKKIKYILKNTFKNNETYNKICKISNLENQTKDLFITGGHSILVNELTEEEIKKTKTYWNTPAMIEDKYLLLACVSAYEKMNDENVYEIYHIVLENDDVDKQYGIYANGVLTETMNEKTYLTKNIITMIQ